jgi:hypothetical protein
MPIESHLAPVRAEIDAMANELFGVIGVPFEQTSELQRQVLAAFAFGMIFAEGNLKGLRPPEVHALVILCLTDVFKYAAHQAAPFGADLISAASTNSRNRTTNAIIHRGIDGHRQWQQKDLDGLKANIEGILRTLGA